MTDNPKPHSFDWLIEPVERQAMEVPLPMPPGATLRVVIEARARVVPTRGWGLIFLVFAVIALILLSMIAANTAHGATWADQDAQRRAPAWGSWDSPRSAPAWGAQLSGETTTYHPYQRQDGTVGRCAVWQWRGEPQMRCE